MQTDRQPLPEISTVEQHRVEEEERAAHEKQMTEALGAEMGIEGFAGADYEGSIDLDLIQRALDGDTTPAAKKTGIRRKPAGCERECCRGRADNVGSC